MTLDLDGADSVLGRSVVIYGSATDATRIVACGMIQPGCSPCRDGSCDPPAEESDEESHIRPYHPTGRHHQGYVHHQHFDDQLEHHHHH